MIAIGLVILLLLVCALECFSIDFLKCIGLGLYREIFITNYHYHNWLVLYGKYVLTLKINFHKCYSNWTRNDVDCCLGVKDVDSEKKELKHASCED